MTDRDDKPDNDPSDLADVLAAAVPGASGFGPSIDRPCANGCGTTVHGPGPTWCRRCLEAAEAKDRGRVEAGELAIALDSIPQRWRWARFGGPKSHELFDRVRADERAIVECRRAAPWSDGAVLFGPAGAGKTSLAVAMMREVLGFSAVSVERRKTARFVAARMVLASRAGELDGRGHEYTDAIRASFVVLDDLGAEADTPSSRAAVCDLLAERHAWERPTVITTYLDQAAIALRYGDGIARRMFERGLVVELGT